MKQAMSRLCVLFSLVLFSPAALAQEMSSEDVQENVDYHGTRDIGVVGLSPHDSCDTSIGIFKRSFPDAYREIVVGQEIAIP